MEANSPAPWVVICGSAADDQLSSFAVGNYVF